MAGYQVVNTHGDLVPARPDFPSDGVTYFEGLVLEQRYQKKRGNHIQITEHDAFRFRHHEVSFFDRVSSDCTIS